MTRGNSDGTFRHPSLPAMGVRGPGLQSTLKCWRCNGNKEALGGRLLGRLKLWHCMACVAERTAAVVST